MHKVLGWIAVAWMVSGCRGAEKPEETGVGTDTQASSTTGTATTGTTGTGTTGTGTTGTGTTGTGTTGTGTTGTGTTGTGTGTTGTGTTGTGTTGTGTTGTGTTTSTGTSTTPPPTPMTFDGPVPTNVIFISLDTTRRDFIGRFDPTGSETPTLDSVLDEAVVLENHRSCSNWTAPSMACAVSGRFPADRGWWPLTFDWFIPDVPGAFDSAAVWFGNAGFNSSLVTGNGIFSNLTGLADGYNEVTDLSGFDASVVKTTGLNQLDLLMAQPNPWLLHVHFMDPHATYDPPEGYRDGLEAYGDPGFDWSSDDATGEAVRLWDSRPDKWRENVLAGFDLLYRGELRYFDDQFAEFWAGLDDRGALDDALVVFWTDHGEQFMERGQIEHALNLFAEENRSTAAFWARNLEPYVHTDVTLHQDVGATVADVYGLTPTFPIEGLPVGTAPADRAVRHFAYFAGTTPQLGITKGDRTLLYNWDGAKFFFHNDTDPAQLEDVYDSADPDVIDLWDAMAPFVEGMYGEWGHFGPPTSPEP